MQVSGMKERMGECGGSPVSQRQGFLAKRGTIQNAVEGSYTTLFDQEVQQEGNFFVCECQTEADDGDVGV